MDTTTSPREIDTKLAALYLDLYRAEDRAEMLAHTLQRLAGAEYRYRGRRRVTDMTVDEAIARVESGLSRLSAWRDSHEGERMWIGFDGPIPPYEQDSAERALLGYYDQTDRVQSLTTEIDDLERSYSGWSRFFLVTSSPGHVHSSMYCSTCRPTTRYGWLPEMSGETEDVAVVDLGPTLCSVCFPSAPVEYTEGKKITAAQAAKRAYGA